MTFGFLVGCKNLTRFFCFFEKFLFHTGRIVIHEMTWECLDVVEHSYPPDSHRNPGASRAHLATVHFVILRRLHFLFVFFGSCWSTRRVSPWLLTHTYTSCCCWIVRADHSILRWRCWRSRCRWRRGTRRQTKDNEWYVVRYHTLIFLQSVMRCGFLTTGPVVGIPMILTEFPKVNELWVFLQEASPSRISFNSLTQTVASSLVCTSPLAVITVAGFFEILMVSNSAALRSLLLTICILALESTTNFLSSGFMVDGAGKLHSSVGEKNVALSCSLS